MEHQTPVDLTENWKEAEIKKKLIFLRCIFISKGFISIFTAFQALLKVRQAECFISIIVFIVRSTQKLGGATIIDFKLLSFSLRSPFWDLRQHYYQLPLRLFLNNRTTNNSQPVYRVKISYFTQIIVQDSRGSCPISFSYRAEINFSLICQHAAALFYCVFYEQPSNWS